VIKRIFFAAAVALGLTSVGPTDTVAQGIDSPYRFVEHSQGLYGFGANILTDQGSLNTGPASGIAFGAGYNVRISGPFNFSARVTYLPTERTVYDDESTLADSVALRQDPTYGLVEIGTADVTLLLLDASLRFDITGPRTWHRIQPFVLLGVGGALSVSSNNAAEETLPSDRELRVRFGNGFTGHVGAGVEVHLSDRLTLQADARDLLWKLKIPQGFLLTGRVISRDDWVQTAHFSLGLKFRF
jgi:opacity protein-like surface antigen